MHSFSLNRQLLSCGERSRFCPAIQTKDKINLAANSVAADVELIVYAKNCQFHPNDDLWYIPFISDSRTIHVDELSWTSTNCIIGSEGKVWGNWILGISAAFILFLS